MVYHELGWFGQVVVLRLGDDTALGRLVVPSLQMPTLSSALTERMLAAGSQLGSHSGPPPARARDSSHRLTPSIAARERDDLPVRGATPKAGRAAAGLSDATPALLRPTAVKSTPPQPPKPPKSQPVVQAGTAPSLDLTDDERTLRGLMQFFVTSDVRRRGNTAPLSVKYKEFIRIAHDVLSSRETRVQGATPGRVLQKEESSVPSFGPGRKRTAEQIERVQRRVPTTTEVVRKAEEVLEAHVSLSRLAARKAALTAQVKAVRKARDLKSAEQAQMNESLGALKLEEDRRAKRLRASLGQRMEGCMLAMESPNIAPVKLLS